MHYPLLCRRFQLWRFGVAVTATVSLLIALALARPATASAQDLGFCASTGDVFLYDSTTDMVYQGTAVREPEGLLEGFTTDTYSFTATSANGTMVFGTFKLTEAQCAVAPGGWTMPTTVIIEGYSYGGPLYG